jgi:UDP-3-O-[3-hydroxymyristoyl] glucosamine N-acyltransferase
VFSTSPSITTPTLVGDVTLSTGNLVVSSGKGVDFSAVVHSGSTSKLLADYEEGTWTAAFVAGGGTITINNSYKTGAYTKIGRQVMIGGQAGIVGHISIGDGAKINAQSGVSKSLENGKTVTGTPAYDYTQALRGQAALRKLPEMQKRLQELEDLVKELAQKK